MVFVRELDETRGYRSNVVLTSPMCIRNHPVDGEIGNFICWELCVGISEQWNCSLGSSWCFDGARIPGASRNCGIRLCHPCHSPGFISRKSGNETAFLPPSGTHTGRAADKEGHSHRWDVIWHCARLRSHTLSKDIIFRDMSGVFLTKPQRVLLK